MSPAHCCAVQISFDRIVEQPTERLPTWDCKQARTCPPPGLTPAHRDWTSVEQSRSEVNIPSCALAPTEPVSSNAAPSAIVAKAVFMTVSPFSFMTNTLARPDVPAGDFPVSLALLLFCGRCLCGRCRGRRAFHPVTVGVAAGAPRLAPPHSVRPARRGRRGGPGRLGVSV